MYGIVSGVGESQCPHGGVVPLLLPNQNAKHQCCQVADTEATVRCPNSLIHNTLYYILHYIILLQNELKIMLEDSLKTHIRR